MPRERDHRLAVRSQRHRLDLRRRDVELFRDEVPEPARVQYPRHPHHALAPEPARLRGEVGHLVERVRDDDDDRVGRAVLHVVHDVSDDARVLLQEVHPAHARLSRQTGGDHDDVRPSGVPVIVRPDDVRLESLHRARLAHVEGDALRQPLDDVDENDLGEALLDHPHGRGGTDEPAPDDRDSHACSLLVGGCERNPIGGPRTGFRSSRIGRDPENFCPVCELDHRQALLVSVTFHA